MLPYPCGRHEAMAGYICLVRTRKKGKKKEKKVKCEGRVITVALRGNRRRIQEVATVRSRRRKLCTEKDKAGNKMKCNKICISPIPTMWLFLNHRILIFQIGHIYKYIILIAVISNSCVFYCGITTNATWCLTPQHVAGGGALKQRCRRHFGCDLHQVCCAHSFFFLKKNVPSIYVFPPKNLVMLQSKWKTRCHDRLRR